MLRALMDQVGGNGVGEWLKRGCTNKGLLSLGLSGPSPEKPDMALALEYLGPQP